MGIHEPKKLLDSKGNGQQTEEAAHRMGENFASNGSDEEGLLTRIYMELKKLNSQRINNGYMS
jgi:hypothetical protein